MSTKIHFISIGGSVMHQLAIALHYKGYTITGSDDEIFEPSKTNLQAVGLLPQQMGWNTSNINAGLSAVILGMHAKADNPELIKAKELGLKIYSFPEYIYEESKLKTRVVVGGSHGKTTTTAMIMHALQQNNKAFDYMVGARLDGFAQSVNITNATVIVCEGDEYPASTLNPFPKFHFLYPHVAILTGIAWDHINVFPTFEFYLQQFIVFINKIEKGGVLIYNATDETLTNLVNANLRADIRYQPYQVPQHHINNGKTNITIDGISADIQVFGQHNLLNLHAAFFACKELGLPAENFIKGIAGFTGASKRLELLATTPTYNVYRDFAHAPSKVKATIEAVKAQYPGRKLIAVLELHTYSSLNENFMQEYSSTMEAADVAVVFFSQHALQLKRMPPLPKEAILAGFKKDGLLVIDQKEELLKWLQAQAYTNTNLLLMSSGNYDGADVVGFAITLQTPIQK